MYTASETVKEYIASPLCGMYSMCTQWQRAVLRGQTREVQEDSVRRQLDCQSPESSSSSPSSPSLSSPFPIPVLVSVLVHTHTSERAIDTKNTSILSITVLEREVATTAITTEA